MRRRCCESARQLRSAVAALDLVLEVGDMENLYGPLHADVGTVLAHLRVGAIGGPAPQRRRRTRAAASG